MHSISVYLLRKEDVRDEKISQFLDNKKAINIKYTELNCGIVAMTKINNIKQFGKDKTIAKIETNYFGGGDQSAKLFINNKKVYDKSDDRFRLGEKDWALQPINDVLKEMGVAKHSGMDEFDTIGLGKYRTNEDFK
jgi:hypothetical protein